MFSFNLFKKLNLMLSLREHLLQQVATLKSLILF